MPTGCLISDGSTPGHPQVPTSCPVYGFTVATGSVRSGGNEWSISIIARSKLAVLDARKCAIFDAHLTRTAVRGVSPCNLHFPFCNAELTSWPHPDELRPRGPALFRSRHPSRNAKCAVQSEVDPVAALVAGRPDSSPGRRAPRRTRPAGVIARPPSRAADRPSTSPPAFPPAPRVRNGPGRSPGARDGMTDGRSRGRARSEGSRRGPRTRLESGLRTEWNRRDASGSLTTSSETGGRAGGRWSSRDSGTSRHA